MNCNAIRTSHNPPAQMLQLCDDWGLVINEAFDEWKNSNVITATIPFGTNGQKDMVAFIHRDLNILR